MIAECCFFLFFFWVWFGCGACLGGREKRREGEVGVQEV